jgi:hypothetical protein
MTRAYALFGLLVAALVFYALALWLSQPQRTFIDEGWGPGQPMLCGGPTWTPPPSDGCRVR